MTTASSRSVWRLHHPVAKMSRMAAQIHAKQPMDSSSGRERAGRLGLRDPQIETMLRISRASEETSSGKARDD